MSNGHSIIILLLLLMTSCASINNFLNPEQKYFIKDMSFEINNEDYAGIAVVDTKKSYKIKTKFGFKAKLVKFTTCHREIVFDKPMDAVKINYAPSVGIEDQGFCPIEISAFNEEGADSWAYIDFRRDESLLAMLKCNGGQETYVGVSICQARSGLLQSISFANNVELVTAYPCEKPDSYDNKLWTYVISVNRCIYIFKDRNGDIHRLLTIGYNDI